MPMIIRLLFIELGSYDNHIFQDKLSKFLHGTQASLENTQGVNAGLFI